MSTPDTISSARQRRRISKQKQDLRQDLYGPKKMHSASDTSLERMEGEDDADGKDNGDIKAENCHQGIVNSDFNRGPSQVLFIDDNALEVDKMDIPSEADPPIDEVEDFFSLLDSTLHLPEVDACVCSETLPPVGSKEDILLPSGRLAERIRSLKLYVSTYIFGMM